MKGIIMSNKSSKVVNPTVTAEQFAGSLNSIRTSGNSAKAAMTTACKFIAQCTNYADQSKAKKELASAYKAFQTSISLKPIATAAAVQWVQRTVKAMSGDTKFKWLVSTSASAQKKAKQRKARQTKAPATTAPATTAPATTAPATTAPAEKLTSIEQYRNAIIAKENEILDNYRNFIPAGKREKFEQIFALFIASIKETLV
jgi:hypothetical protein